MSTLYNINNVSTFQGYSVVDGQVEVDESSFDDMLDDCYGEVVIMGMEYSTSKVLYDCDPVAYRCAKADYESSTQSELEYAIEHEDYSDIVWVCDPEDTE